MALTAETLLLRVYAALDDTSRLHTPEAVGLRALSRAQEWVAIRFRLLRRPYRFPLDTDTALYLRRLIAPKAVTLVSADLNGAPLHITPFTDIRNRDTQWLATTGTPQYIYCIRWSLWGFYPVPNANIAVSVACLVAPDPITSTAQTLELPDGYDDHVEHVAVGLLLMGRERASGLGKERIKVGLGLTAQQAQRLTTRYRSGGVT